MIVALRDEWRCFLVALQFLTRIPVPGRWLGTHFDPDWLNRSVRHFPLVGALVGGFGGLVAVAAALPWPPMVAAALAVAATVWLTVAFHEDGLADSCDALLGHASRERALSILKDSRIGSYGAVGLVLGLLLRVALLAEALRIDPWLALLGSIAAHAGGRAAAVALMASLPYGGDEEHARAKPLARGVRFGDVGVAAALALLATLPLCAVLPIGVSALALAAIGAALVALVLGFRRWLHRRLGGYTGDTLGACEQGAEITVWLALLAAAA